MTPDPTPMYVLNNIYISVNIRSVKGGVSPLFAAAQEGHLEAVRTLVAAGADVDRDFNKWGIFEFLMENRPCC